jgi:hypothetical protein
MQTVLLLSVYLSLSLSLVFSYGYCHGCRNDNFLCSYITCSLAFPIVPPGLALQQMFVFENMQAGCTKSLRHVLFRGVI